MLQHVRGPVMIRLGLIVVGVLALLVLGVGFAARWQMVGLLDLADRFSSGPAGERIAEAVPYADADPIQSVDVYAPAGATVDQKRPVIIWFHGGGWRHGDRQTYGFAGRAFAAEGFYNEVQIVCTVMSCNPEIDPDIPALLGASAALAISGIPFNGPIGAARVGYINGSYVLCPTKTQLLESTQLDLVVAGTQAAVLMVESEAKQLTEEVMLGAVVFGHEQMQVAINAINEMVESAGKPEWDWQAAPRNEPLIARVGELAESELREAYRITSK